MPNITRQDISAKMNEITFRVRSLDDPAVQALLVTEGSLNFGMDPSTKMALSVVGLLTSIAFMGMIVVKCIAFQLEQKERCL